MGCKLRKYLEQRRSSKFYRLLEEAYQRPFGHLPVKHMVTFCRFRRARSGTLVIHPPAGTNSSQELDTIRIRLTPRPVLTLPDLKMYFIKSFPCRFSSQETLLSTIPLVCHLQFSIGDATLKGLFELWLCLSSACVMDECPPVHMSAVAPGVSATTTLFMSLSSPWEFQFFRRMCV